MKIEANGIQINYELSGKEGAPVVMLSHSLGTNMAMWNPQIEALEQHFQVLRYDTRGHGSTDAPNEDYSLEQLGEDAIGLLDALDIARVHWVGLSMGGMIGQQVALSHADRLLSLSLCDTASAFAKEAQPIWDERINTARHQGMRALVEETMARWFTPSYLGKNSPGVEKIRAQYLATPVAGYVGCSRAIQGLDFKDRLHQIDTPTLIIVGEEDPGTPVSMSQAMHKRIRNSVLVILPSAAHLSNIEQAEAFNKTLITFLLEQ